MWQTDSKQAGADAASAPANQGPGPGKSTRTDQLYGSQLGPGGNGVFVEFSSAGDWQGTQVLDRLSAQTTVPDDLKAAILAGARPTAMYCAELRKRVSATGDASRKAEVDKIAGALTSRITELTYATPQSPLQYTQLADVARWGTQYVAGPAAAKAPPGAGAATPDAAAASGTADPANQAAETYATKLAGGPGARIRKGDKDQIRGEKADFTNVVNDEHAGDDSGNPALAGWKFLRDPFDNTVTAVKPDGTGLQFTYLVEAGDGGALKVTLARSEQLSKLRVGALHRQDKMAPQEAQESEATRAGRVQKDSDDTHTARDTFKAASPANKAAAEKYEKDLATYLGNKPLVPPAPVPPVGYPADKRTTACTDTPGTVYHAAGGNRQDGFPFTPPTEWKSFRTLASNPEGPKPGDVYYLWDIALNRGAHMGVFKSASPVAGSPDLQTWVVTDGGQGSYAAIQLAQERTRGPFSPKTGMFSSSIAEAGQGKGARKLTGWVDIDAYFAEHDKTK